MKLVESSDSLLAYSDPELLLHGSGNIFFLGLLQQFPKHYPFLYLSAVVIHSSNAAHVVVATNIVDHVISSQNSSMAIITSRMESTLINLLRDSLHGLTAMTFMF